MTRVHFYGFLTAMFFIGFAPVSAQVADIQKVRKSYFEMSMSEDAPLKLYEQLKSPSFDMNPVFVAYRGAARAASAGGAFSPLKKLQCFNQGRDDLEKAVQRKPLDPEIRFLRFATQLKAPSFLGYNGDVENDRNFLVRSIAAIQVNLSNKYLYRQICIFLLSEGNLSPEEVKIIKQQVVRINSVNHG
jgi:hypothetical protein